MKQSAELDKLAAAMAKAQDAMKPALKDSKANYGKYADLSSVWDACRESLGNHGLSVLQGLGTEGGADGHLWTMLLHESGQWVLGECPLILGKRDPQGVGAAMTYYRRYGLAAMLGIIQEDDDGQSAMPKKTDAKPSQGQAPAPTADMDAASVILQDWAIKLTDTKTPEELDTVWATVPSAHKSALFATKSAHKKTLGGK